MCSNTRFRVHGSQQCVPRVKVTYEFTWQKGRSRVAPKHGTGKIKQKQGHRSLDPNLGSCGHPTQQPVCWNWPFVKKSLQKNCFMIWWEQSLGFLDPQETSPEELQISLACDERQVEPPVQALPVPVQGHFRCAHVQNGAGSAVERDRVTSGTQHQLRSKYRKRKPCKTTREQHTNNIFRVILCPWWKLNVKLIGFSPMTNSTGMGARHPKTIKRWKISLPRRPCHSPDSNKMLIVIHADCLQVMMMVTERWRPNPIVSSVLTHTRSLVPCIQWSMSCFLYNFFQVHTWGQSDSHCNTKIQARIQMTSAQHLSGVQGFPAANAQRSVCCIRLFCVQTLSSSVQHPEPRLQHPISSAGTTDPRVSFICLVSKCPRWTSRRVRLEKRRFACL